MKFSMNGFRRQLSNDCRQLKEIALSVISGDLYENDELIDAVNQLITHSNVINCVSIAGEANFSDMSDLEIEHLEFYDDKQARSE